MIPWIWNSSKLTLCSFNVMVKGGGRSRQIVRRVSVSLVEKTPAEEQKSHLNQCCLRHLASKCYRM